LRIRRRVDDLSSYSHLGRPGRQAGTRELPVPGTPYVVIYRIEKSIVEIATVLHGRQEWPPAE
jgi:toxin ParE1/3/4